MQKTVSNVTRKTRVEKRSGVRGISFSANNMRESGGSGQKELKKDRKRKKKSVLLPLPSLCICTFVDPAKQKRDAFKHKSKVVIITEGP